MEENGKKISCVIPSFNEGPRIEAVLDVVHDHHLIDEVIVVDDASKDNTVEIVKTFRRVKLLIHKENTGKSRAVVDGITASSGDIIFLLDADLIGLTAQSISDLIEPVLKGTADLGTSLRTNSPWIFKKIGLDYISGERVFSRELVEDHLARMAGLPRFGLEVYMNNLIIKNKYRIKVVYWGGVISPWPHKKRRFLRGLKAFFLMNLDILRTVSVFEVIRQILQMRLLRV